MNNVVVTLGGSQSRGTRTDLDGYYSFMNLPSGGNYSVTPSLIDYTFRPDSRSFRDLNDNETGTNFVVFWLFVIR
jgi:hypothetical protein